MSKTASEYLFAETGSSISTVTLLLGKSVASVDNTSGSPVAKLGEAGRALHCEQVLGLWPERHPPGHLSSEVAAAKASITIQAGMDPVWRGDRMLKSSCSVKLVLGDKQRLKVTMSTLCGLAQQLWVVNSIWGPEGSGKDK